MAGNPKRMFSKFTAIDSRLTEAVVALRELTPDQYRPRANERDPLGLAWTKAYGASIELSTAMDDLGDLLRVKAGVPDPVVDWDGPKTPEATAACAGGEP